MGLAVLCTTAFNASAIEVGTSFMLETEFGMGPKAIGFFIGIVFAFSAALCILTAIVRELGLSPDWVTMMFMQALALVGMPFLIDVQIVRPGKYQLLLADSLIYPSIVTTSGIAYGLAFASVGSGTLLNQETLTLAFVWSDSLGRIIAGPLVRTVLEHWGRNYYAGLQFALLVLGAILGLLSPVLQRAGPKRKEPIAQGPTSQENTVDEEASVTPALPRLLGSVPSESPVEACQPIQQGPKRKEAIAQGPTSQENTVDEEASVTPALPRLLGSVPSESPVEACQPIQQGPKRKEAIAQGPTSQENTIDEEASETPTLPRLLGSVPSECPVEACQPIQQGSHTVMSEACFKYAGWTIDNLVASKTFPGTTQPETIKLVPAEAIPYQGWWPREPAEAPKVVLAGCCLFDGRWKARCFPRGKGNPPAVKSLSSSTRRDELFARLKKGHKVECVFVPSGLGEYHRRVIRWQAEALKALQPEKVVYHLPVQEYHHYIDDFEAHLGVRVPRMHELLDEFGEAVKTEVVTYLSPFTDTICFIEPMTNHGCECPNDSFLWPYLNVHEFGDARTVAGLEDLPEMYLSSSASKQTGMTIPVLCGVLAVDVDLYRQEELNEGEFEQVQIRY
eukprot:TRINITY_DN1147_c0_g2_i4.p1 TRINITY_DN1147_c0_g2~~TRINITY_DN1147_c0_g2_i4.p1  ORF type:complete len:620 (-),score=103.67 TRINITY_DN1147_c0_g2_i4:210-2069(-)